jgi:hypothetical protein
VLRREEGWLLYDAPVHAGRPGACPGIDPERLLVWSGELSGGCKFAHAPERPLLRVRAELPAADPATERAAAVEAGFAAAAQRLGLANGAAAVAAERLGLGPDLEAAQHRNASYEPAAHTPAPDLATLCREAGWPFEERTDGSLSVDLGVRGIYLVATVEPRGAGIALEAELATLPAPPGPCRSALLLLLLRANGAFRMARAVLRMPHGTLDDARDAAARVVLEVALPSMPGAGELSEAIAAIAVAAQRSALEARCVASDERLARAYLDWSAASRRA